MLAFEWAGSGVSSNMSSHVCFAFHGFIAKFIWTLVHSIANPNWFILEQNEITFSQLFFNGCVFLIDSVTIILEI